MEGDDPIYTPVEVESTQSQVEPSVDTASPAETITEPTEKKRGRPKVTAPVWQHFRQGVMKESGFYDAICIYCEKKYEMGNQKSTSSLQHHFERGCKKIPPIKRQKKSDALQKLLQTAKSHGTASPVAWVFDQATCRKSLANMIIVHEYPFNIITHHFFRVFLNDLQPQFRTVSRNTVRADCIKIYKEEEVALYGVLNKLDCRVSFTSDLWSNQARDRGFLALTCHFIDDQWKLKKRILNFSKLPAPHTGKAIADAIFHRMVLWNLDKKAFSLTLDNATSNDVCIRELLTSDLKETLPVDGSIFHQRCSCHILNLIVQDGLDVLPGTIDKIRETMKYIRHSQSRMESYQRAATQVNGPNKRPAMDVSTRWNSTYLMLELAVEIRPTIVRYASLDKKYKLLPTEEEWENITVLMGFLKVFYDATLKLSGTKYPTLNLFFPEYCEVFLSIKKMELSSIDFVKKMGVEMLKKWEKYWTRGNTLLAIACILDPRCKLAVVEYYFGMIYPEDCAMYVANLKECLNALFQEYKEEHMVNTQSQAGSSTQRDTHPSRSSSVSNTRAGLKDFIRGRQNVDPVKSDLDQYLSDPLDGSSLEDEFDILCRWKVNAAKYPIMSRLTRDILAVPISTVPSESVFSTSGRTLSPVRNSLNDESMEALICAQDWLRASITENDGMLGDPLWISEETGTDGIVGTKEPILE